MEQVPKLDFKGKTALVTGASRGIGDAISTHLATHGAHVILVSRKREGLESVAQKIHQQGGQATVHPTHLGNLDDLHQMAQTLKEQGTNIDILVNNAATNPFYGPLQEVTDAVFQKTFDVNVKGPLFLCQNLVPLMPKGSSIIHVSSVNAFRPPAFQGIYSMTKAAVIAMTKVQAKELAPLGIRVNTIAPGLTDTKFAKALIDNPKLRASYIDHTPLDRPAAPDEISGAVLYLASDLATYTTGTCLTVDGGYLS